MDKFTFSGTPEQLMTMLSTAQMTYQMMQGIEPGGGSGGKSLSAPKRKTKPQIILYFLEKKADVEKGHRPLDGEIKFRIMNKESDTLTETDVKTIAERIKSKFAKPQFAWHKGKEMISYTDWEKGYQLQILCKDKAVGAAVAEQALDIQGYSLDLKNMNHIVNQAAMERYPTIPDRVVILGEIHKLERQRPLATVWFQYAELRLWGRLEPITLVDLTGKRLNPVVSVDPIVS
jgi:hypothetical protein